MVNNKQQLEEKISANRNSDFQVVKAIYGLEEMNEWFQRMLYDMCEDDFWKIKGDINSGLKDTKNSKLLSLRTKFHQQIFVAIAQMYLNKEGDEKRKTFIWGAVPRSGKSYMIADLINKRKDTGNNVLIVLGAKTETEQQFKKYV